MVLVLDSTNFLDYLAEIGLAPAAQSQVTAKTISARNFNLIVRSPGKQTLLIKQETLNVQGQQAGKLFREWQLQELLAGRPDLQPLGAILPEVWHCDRANSIVVNRFFEEYCDLSDYYDTHLDFSPQIATALGRQLGEIHSLTFEQPDHQRAILEALGNSRLLAQRFTQQMEWLHSGIFGKTPLDCLRFYKLYQQYPSLALAVGELATENQACCLVHNDLKLSNILIHNHWTTTTDAVLRLIDWEVAGWGDPASDLGSLIGSYLGLWLDGLIVGAGLSMSESLQLATVPLESLQPSLFALVDSYFQVFPQILAAQPSYLEKVLQHVGLALIGQIEATIEYDRTFGNQEIVTLQVAKQLLCTPLAFVHTMFGEAANQLPIPKDHEHQ
jgi:thiamine kinase-like enzyme